VGIDGNGFRVVARPSDSAGAPSDSYLNHPAYGVGGAYVFEANWPSGIGGGQSEQVWKLQTGSAAALLSRDRYDDNSPCTLPQGRIASLWLGRPGNTDNKHELKIMSADGSGEIMPLLDQDVIDADLSCSP
jgi:hypothetical protein